MTTATTILDKLRSADVIVEIAGDRLRLRSPVGPISDDLRAQIRTHKAGIMAVVEKEQPRKFTSAQTLRQRIGTVIEKTQDDRNLLVRFWCVMKHLEHRGMIWGRSRTQAGREYMAAIREGFEMCRDAIGSPDQPWGRLDAESAASRLHSDRLKALTCRAGSASVSIPG